MPATPDSVPRPESPATKGLGEETSPDDSSRVEVFIEAALAQRGDPYAFGAEARLDDPDPDAFDNSELTQWAAHQAGVSIPDGSMSQYLELKSKGKLVSVAEGLRTKGALLFYFSSEPTPGGGRPAAAHVAISLGDGRTIEARGKQYGVNNFPAGERFNYAGVILELARATPSSRSGSTARERSTTVRSVRLSIREIYNAARAAGFTPKQATIWTAIALAESGGETGVLDATGGKVGLWQIDVSPGVRANTWGDLSDPYVNARAAYEISRQGTDMRPWPSTHASHAGTATDYRTYLDEVRAVTGVLPDKEGADPPVVDSDGDGLSDSFERSSGLDPCAPDSDGDALEKISGTDPAMPDPGDPTRDERGTTGGSTKPECLYSRGRADAFVAAAQTQRGDAYVFGVEVALDDPDPDAFDNSELTQWAAHQVGVEITDGSWLQYLELKKRGRLMPVEQGLNTKGALLFYFSSEPTPGGDAPSQRHVAISLGDGRTIEAKGTSYGVNEFGAAGRFNYAGEILELSEACVPGKAGEAPLTTPSPDPPDWDRDGLSDAFERMLGLDPTSSDSDGDGTDDAVEALGAGGISATPADSDSDSDSLLADASHWAADVFVAAAQAQRGDSYAFGAEASLTDPDPDWFDCSELTQWAAAQAGVTIPDGSWLQYLELKGESQLVSVAEGLRTKGALLFYFSSEPTPGGGRPSSAHVAVSLGDGRTIEAKGSSYGVNEFPAAGRFNYAGLIPEMVKPLRILDDWFAVPVPDSDADGLSDAFERTVGLDPFGPDSAADRWDQALEKPVAKK